MKIIKFNITGQDLKRIDNERLVSGTKNYIQCSFEFDQDWNGMDKAVKFESNGMEVIGIIKNDVFDLPNDLSDYHKIKMTVFGKRKDQEIKTNSVIIRQR